MAKITAGPFYVAGGRQYDFNMTDHLLMQPQPDAAVLQQIVDAIEQTVGYALPLPASAGFVGPNWWLRNFSPRSVPEEMWLRVIDPAANLTPIVDQLYDLVNPRQIWRTNGVLNQVFLSFTASKDAPYNIIIDHFGPFGENEPRQLKEKAQRVYKKAKEQAKAAREAKEAKEQEEPKAKEKEGTEPTGGGSVVTDAVNAGLRVKALLERLTRAKAEQEIAVKALESATVTAAKTAEKEAAKEAAEVAVKKVPGIGLLAGLGFGIFRAFHGDWSGAGMEVASGAAAVIPAYGTAVSMGIDAALLAKDVANAVLEANKEAGGKAEEVKRLKEELKMAEAEHDRLLDRLEANVKQLVKAERYYQKVLDGLNETPYVINPSAHGLAVPETEEQLAAHLRSFRLLTAEHKVDSLMADYLASHLVIPSGVTGRDEIARALAAADFPGNMAPLVLAALTKSTHVSEVMIESSHTGRYLFEAAPDGDVRSIRGNEGGWIHKNNVPVLTADANYYGRAVWTIINV